MPVKYRATNIITREVIEGTAEGIAEKISVSAQNVYSCAVASCCLMRTWKIEKAGRVPYTKTCVVCGTVFESESKKALYCSPRCLNKSRSMSMDGWVQGLEKSKKQQTLEDDAVNAMQADQTYGKYKAQLYLEEEKRKRVEDLKILYNLNR